MGETELTTRFNFVLCNINPNCLSFPSIHFVDYSVYSFVCLHVKKIKATELDFVYSRVALCLVAYHSVGFVSVVRAHIREW